MSLTVPRSPAASSLRVGALVFSYVASQAGCGGGTSPTTPASTSSMPTPAPTPSPSPHPLADYIEAIFLGSGPLTPRDGAHACPWSTPIRFSGWPRGTQVRVRISTTASARTRAVVGGVVDQMTLATNGTVAATLEITGEPDPVSAQGEITMTLRPDPGSTGCVAPYGCIHHTWQSPGVFVAGRAVLDRTVPPQGWAHELGHGILGMCHVDGSAVGGARNSLMSGGPGVFSGDLSEQLSPNDIAATQAVYAAGVQPGASRADFVRLGLVRP
jgi:hypothetical protein